ncbi:hypothetical protein [Variovorax sp. YR216]|uniref:hypothetical protein n=1 Tax=Variovorax sp. YR216 TaxID=1882828 RepID=UPI000895BE8E|nr:hypothetical protein [Variovorax sp. YR216]SEB09912.1 hypothetical protein SAMN05444680_107228 [Variovorax sp. YR216]
MSTTLANGLSIKAPRDSSFPNALSRRALAWLLRLLTGWKMPAPDVPLTRKAEADALRDWAWTLAHSHRGFSDDLFAAADRHERTGS